MLPPEVGCSREARDLLMSCCIGTALPPSIPVPGARACVHVLTLLLPRSALLSEFIHLVAFEASDICEKGKKKTIGGEHVVEALTKLGFEGYVPEVAKSVDDVKEEAKVRATNTHIHGNAHCWP